jgi:Uma2 family endonuclease
MASLPRPFLTPEQYLELERQAEIKSEYYNGETFAMSGGSVPHSLLQMALARVVGNRLDLEKCGAYSSDMRVQVSDTGLFAYPDFTVVCGEPRCADSHVDTLLNPIVIAEVISHTSESYDRGDKFKHYRTIATLRHYMLVSQWEVVVEVFTREGDRWYVSSSSEGGGLVQLHAIGVEFPVDELYRGVRLADPPASRPKPPARSHTPS